MTYRWLISFSLALAPAWGATVSGAVELLDSRETAVRKQKNYSGVVVWLEAVGHSVPAPAPAVARMMQKGKKFTPHVVAIPVGGTVDFPNFDPIFHNAFSNFSGQPFDVGLYAPGTTQKVTFRRDGVVRVFCNIHATMSAVIVVVKTPYYAVTGADGAFRFANVAPGEYQLRIWHERATEEKLRSAERTVRVEEAELAVGRIALSESGYLVVPHQNKYGKDYPPEALDKGLYSGTKK